MLLLQHTLKTASNLVGTVTSLMSHMDSETLIFRTYFPLKYRMATKNLGVPLINLDLKSEQAK